MKKREEEEKKETREKEKKHNLPICPTIFFPLRLEKEKKNKPIIRIIFLYVKRLVFVFHQKTKIKNLF
jgi:hypothetical protein